MVRIKRGKKKVSVEQLIRDGQACLDRMQPEAAAEYFQRAHLLRPDDTNIMDALADVLIQIDQPEEALGLLQMSTNTAPATNPGKWMYLAQLLEGMDARAAYESGIHFITEEFQQTEPETQQWYLLRRQICKAHCSIAELYLTDLCYEDDAEQTCQASVERAMEIEPDSLEVRQVQASLLISQERKEAAAECVKYVGNHLLELRNATQVEDAPPNEEALAILESLGSEFPVETCKLLAECADVDPSCADVSIELLTDLLCEDDDNIELWYLLGVAGLACQPPDYELAEQHLQTALEMLNKIQEECANAGEEFPFEEQLQLVHEHLEIVHREQPMAAPAEGDEHDENGDIDS